MTSQTLPHIPDKDYVSPQYQRVLDKYSKPHQRGFVKAFDHYHNGRFKEAVEFYELYFQDHINENTSNDRRMDIHQSLAVAYNKCHRYEEELVHLEKALEIDVTYHEQQLKVGIYRQYGDTLAKLHRLPEAIEMYRKGFKLVKILYEHDIHVYVQRERKHFASVLLQHGLTTEQKEEGKKLMLQWGELNCESERNSYESVRMQITFLLSEDGRDVPLARRKALKMYTTETKRKPQKLQEVIKACDTCAGVEYSAREFEKSAAFFTKSLEYRSKLYPKKNDENNIVGITNLARVLVDLKEWEKALELWKQALMMSRVLHNNVTIHEEYIYLMGAITHCLSECKPNKFAIRNQQKLVQMCRELLAQHLEEVETLEIRKLTIQKRSYIYDALQLAEVEENEENEEEQNEEPSEKTPYMVVHYDKMIEEHVKKTHHFNTLLTETLWNLTSYLEKSERFKEEDECFEEIIAIRRDMSPESNEYKALAIIYQQRGLMYHTNKDTTNAEKWFMESIQFTIATEGETSQNVVNSYYTMARFLEKEGKISRAFHMFNDRKEIHAKILVEKTKSETLVDDVFDLILFCTKYKHKPEKLFDLLNELLTYCDKYHQTDGFTIAKAIYSSCVYCHMLDMKKVGIQTISKLLGIWNKRKGSQTTKNPLTVFKSNANYLYATIVQVYEEEAPEKQIDINVVINTVCNEIEKIQCIL